MTLRIKNPRAPRALPLLALPLLLVAHTAAAQGLVDATTQADVPNSSSAAADDGYAAMVNPAGLAFVDALQLTGGYMGRFGNSPRDVILANLAFAPFDGFTLGAGTGMVLTPIGVRTPYFKNTFSLATRFDRFFALGANFHALTDATPGADTLWRSDVGVQIRPWRWVSLGGSVDGLGAMRPDLPSMRFGAAIRPFLDQVTIATDLRVSPGNDQVFTQSFYTGASLTPGATARVHFGGLAITAGVSMPDVLGPAGPQVAGSVGIQVDTSHLGALLLGGADTTGNLTAGALGRASVERFQSVWPGGGSWVAMSLVGRGGLDRPSDDFIEDLLNPPVHPVTVLTGLERARTDDRVEGVVLRLRGLSLGWGRMMELREAVLALRAAGKMVVVHLDGGDDVHVFLASAADRVILSPAGGLALDGLSAQLLHFANVLDRVGVHADAVFAGEFKTGPNSFTKKEPTEQELIVINDLLDSFYSRLVEGIADGRGIAPDDVKAIIDRGGLTADAAVETEIVDQLGYWDQVPAKIEDLAGGSKPSLDTTYLDDLLRTERWSLPPRIAVIPITGTIVQGRARPGLLGLGGDETGAEDVIDSVQAAVEDDDVKAIVLRIDSPGGDALASDLIWHAVMKARDKKPIIASMGDVAASGGYYVAAAAKEILAEPETITGSIGVYGLMFEGRELASDLGVHVQNVDRGETPPPNVLRPMNSEQRDAMQAQVDWTYERFLKAVHEGRGMDMKKLREVAEGRVWTGTQAKERGLVDAYGGMADAIARARKMAELSPDEPIEVSILTGPDELFPRFGTAVRALVGADADAERVKTALRALGGDPEALQLLGLGGRPIALAPLITVE